ANARTNLVTSNGAAQEYWRQRTLFEIASAIGTPLSLDESIKNRTFGHYARVLVDMDLSHLVFDEVTVEREASAIKIQVDPAPNGVAVVTAKKREDGAIAVHTLEREGNVLSDAIIFATHLLAQQNMMLSTDSGRAIPETTQKVRILSDEDFEEVVRADLQLIKQAWADKEKDDKHFTTVISKSQRKKIKQLARSRG
ncbi:defensin-like protein, partial [Trifolium medium]|nr:defensin-like protein [Trifolium medium]